MGVRDRRRRLPGQQLRPRHASTRSTWPAPSRSSLWHEQASLEGVAAVVLPGGFAYGDYLRAGVIARFSPVMRAVAAFAAEGGLVLGICNGFQVLAEAGLVPGALLRNASLRFAGQEVAHRRRAARHAVHPCARRIDGRCGCRSPTARAATTPTRRRSTRSSATGRSCSATSTRRGAGRTGRPGQSQRLAAGDRRAS